MTRELEFVEIEPSLEFFRMEKEDEAIDPQMFRIEQMNKLRKIMNVSLDEILKICFLEFAFLSS